MQGEQNHFQIVLPTRQILKGIKNQQTAFTSQFLVGYCNVLTERDGQIYWGLVRSKSHCGKAFTFPIQEQDALKVQHFKEADQVIERVGNNFLVLKVEEKITKPASKLSLQTVKGLLQDLGGVNKINLNILKNAFASLSEFRSVVEEQTERQLNVHEVEKQLDIGDKVKIQFSSKQLSGNSLKKLPIISKQTGNWGQNQTVQLKVLQY